MKDMRKTKAQLIDELKELRRELSRCGVNHDPELTTNFACVPRALREKAKGKIVGLKTEDTLGTSDSHDQIYELEIHKTELTMQNEALHCAQQELLDSRELYFDLYEFAPVGYVSLSDKGLIKNVNLTLSSMLGVTKAQLFGQLLSSFVLPEDQDRYYFFWRTLLKNQKEQSCDLRLMRQDNTSFWVSIKSAQFVTGDGEVQGRIRFIIMDWDELRQRKHQADIKSMSSLAEKLYKSEAQFRSVLEAANDAILILTKEMEISFCNLAAQKLFGYRLEEIVGQTLLKVIPQQNIQLYDVGRQPLYEKGKLIFSTHTVELIGCHKKGYTINLELSLAPSDAGDVIQLIAIFRDISERKKTEQIIAEKEVRYRELFNNMHSGVAVFKVLDDGKDFIFLDFNRAAERIEHITSNEVIGRSVFEVFPGVREFGIIEALTHVWRTGNPLRHPVSKYKDGRIEGWRENYIYKLPTGEIVAVYDDVTALKQAEEKLTLNHQQYRAIVDDQTDYVSRFLPDKTLTFVNSALCRMMGLLPEDLIGKKFSSFIDEETDDEIDKCLATISLEHPTAIREHKIFLPDGTVKWHQWVNRGLFDQQGTIVEYQGVGRDITVLKETEEQLRDNKVRYERLVEGSPDILYIYSNTKGALYWSSRVKDVLGYSPDDLLRDPMLWHNAIHPDNLKAVDAAIAASQTGVGFDLEYRIKDTAGKWHWFHDRSISVTSKDNEIIIEGLASDITISKQLNSLHEDLYHKMETKVERQTAELVESEKKLMHADKLKSLGNLATAIAHEIRNPLSGININLNTLEKICQKSCKPEILTSLFNHLKLASRKIETVIRRVMDFSKPCTPQFQLCNINPSIEEALQLTWITLRKTGIEIDIDLSENLPKVRIDPHLFTQVIVNLLINACDALREVKNDKHIVIISKHEGDGIVVKVSDNGPGIPADLKDTIFDPFFTTKDTEGTGIGLSICKRIISDHGGTIFLETIQQRGAVFIIKIPIHKENNQQVITSELADDMDDKNRV